MVASSQRKALHRIAEPFGELTYHVVVDHERILVNDVLLKSSATKQRRVEEVERKTESVESVPQCTEL
jgi:hypothetical protein